MSLRRRAAALVATGLALAGTGALTLVHSATSAGAEPASPATIADVSLTWGLSGEQGGGAFFGGCNFLSAGTAGDTGSSRVWTEADGFHATAAGHVSIEKPDAVGGFAPSTWATKCQGPDGVAVSAGSTASTTGNRVRFEAGEGSVDLSTGTARISWSGSFTSAFYGGLTYWSAADPVLEVEGGTGTLSATLSGHGADMTDPTTWVTVPARTVTLATLRGITLSATGFSVTPDYLGVAVTTPTGTTAQAPVTADNRASWGAFPQDFVDFQQLTGQSSYWFSSGGSRDAAKAATPLAVGWTAPVTPTTPPSPPPVTATPTTSATPPATPPTTTPPMNTTPAGPAASTTAAAASCIPVDAVTAGSLTWGVKHSFRGYVAGAAGTSITTAGGADILAADLAVAGRADSGTIRWPFVSSASYGSARTFVASYGGSVTFTYPAHFFAITIAAPRLTVNAATGVLVADVTSTLSAPGSPTTTERRTGVTVAALTVGASTGGATSGTTVTLGATLEDTAAFSFNGSAFYERGQALDDATAVLADCALAPPPPVIDVASSSAAAAPDLVPTLRFRPNALPVTGAEVSGTVIAGLTLVVLGAAVTLLATRRRPARGRS